MCSLNDAGDVVRLLHIIHPGSKSATEAGTQAITDAKQLVSVSVYCSSDSVYFIQLLHCSAVIVGTWDSQLLHYGGQVIHTHMCH